MAHIVTPVLEMERVSVLFPARGGLLGSLRRGVWAVREVSLEVAAGKTLALVGESGCGKSTLARLAAGLSSPTHGALRLRGKQMASRQRSGRAELHRTVQLVFQDPGGSLNPRKTVRQILQAPQRALLGRSGRALEDGAMEALGWVGLEATHLDRYPHELSGGQAQRVALARALVVKPRLVVLDEAVASLDVSVQAAILRLLADMQRRLGVAYLFISHDLAVVEAVAHEVAVMYLGRIVERGTIRQVLSEPRHPYTRVLLSAVPAIGRRLRRLPLLGDPPSPGEPPKGCAFHPRCYRAEAICAEHVPPLAVGDVDRPVACFFAADSEPPSFVRSERAQSRL